jgi:hypothetical protein
LPVTCFQMALRGNSRLMNGNFSPIGFHPAATAS